MVTSDVRFFLFGGQFSACKIDVAIWIAPEMSKMKIIVSVLARFLMYIRFGCNDDVGADDET